MNSTLTTAFSLLAVVAQAQSQTPLPHFKADPSHTFIYFEIKHLNTSTVRGRFDRTEADISFDAAAGTGKADVTIDAASISTGYPAFDGHLKSADFFNVQAAPTIKFAGDQFTFEGKQLAAVSGRLTLLGQTQPVTLRATHFNCYEHPMHKRQTCGGDFEANITRSQWGMTYGSAWVPDSVRLLIQIEAVRQ